MADVQNTNVFLKQLPNGYTQVLPTGSYRTDGLAYVIQPGTKTDVALLGSGSYGKIYLPGDLKEYTRTVAGSTIRLTRTVDGKLEEIITNANASTPQGHTLQFGDRALNLKELKSYTNDPTFRENLDRSTKEAGIDRLQGQLASVVDPNSSGGAWSTQSGRESGAGFGPEGFLKKMAENFINQTGLTDLNKLGYGKITTPENVPVVRQAIYDYEIDYANGSYYPIVTGYRWATPTADFATDENGFLVSGGYRALSPKEIKTIKDVGNGRYTADVVVGREGYYNKDTGAPVKFNGTLGGYGEGPGWTNTSLTFEGNRPVVKTTGEDSSDLGTILPIISIALLAIPGIGQAIGSAILPTGVSAATATAVGNAVVNAGLQVAAGAPVEQALTNAAASLGVSQLVPNLSGNSFVDNAVRSVATATLTGGDVEKALANSLIATGGNEVLGNVSFTGNATVDSGIASAITSGVMAAATGGDVGQSIARGFAAGTSGQITKEERMAESARSGAGFVGEDVTAPINVADVIGNDTVTSGSGIDSVNAGVAQDNVLDLIQRDIDTSVANNVQGNLNAEQEIQSATPVEPGTSDFTIPGGTTVGEFAEPGTAGFSRNPVTTGVATTGTTGTTGAQDTPYVAPNGMHNRAAFIAAGGGTSDADYAKYVQAVNEVISQGQNGNLIKPSSVNSTGKQLPSTTGPVTTEAPRVDSVLGSVAAQGAASFGQSFGGALSALGFTDAGKAVINKANALADAATVAEGPEITVGKQYINEAIGKLASSASPREAFINLGNLASTIYDNPKAFGAVLGSETFEELLQIGTLRGGGFLTKELIASSIENGGGAYNTEYDKQIRLGAPPEVAHESAQKAAGVAAGATAALGLGVAGAGRLAGVGGGSTSVGNTLAKQTAKEALEAGTVTSAVDYALTGSIDVQNSLREALSDVVYGGPTSGVVQAGSNIISSQIPSSDTSSNVGVVVAVDPNTNQASVIDDGGNITIIPAEGLTPGQNIALPSTPVDTSPVVDQPVVTTPSVTQPKVTTPIDIGPGVSTSIDTGPVVTTPDISVPSVVAPQAPSITTLGIVLQNNNDETSLVLTQGGGSTVVPSVDASTGNQLQPGSSVVVNTTNNTASTAPVTQPTGGEVVSQDANQVVGTESTLPSTSTGGASTGSQVDTGSILGTGTVTTENVGAGAGAGAGVETSTGIVLQNNGDGTVLVLTNNGNASIVSDVDSSTGGTLTTGSSVVVDNNTGTASSTGTGTGTGTGVSDTATGTTTGATTAVDTSGAVTAGTGVTTGATTGDTTGATTGAVTGVTTGDQVDTSGTPVDTGVVDTTQVATGGGVPSTGRAVVDTTGGGLPSTDVGGVVGGEPGGAVDVNEVGGQTGGDIGGLPGGDQGGVLGGDQGGVLGGEVVEEPSVLPPKEIYDSGDITDDEILQLITDDLAGGVEADRGVEEEGDGGLPTEDTQLTVTPRVVSTPPVRVPAGQRVQDTSGILPTRVALSEGSGDDVYGTPEEEQDPVWNIRSLKLRRALRI